MKIAPTLALALALGFGLAACHGPKSAEALKKEQCDRHPEVVALYRDGERPARPYRVLTEVDALFFVSKASRTRTLQAKACALGADAVIDVTGQPVAVREKLAITPWGAVAVREVRPGPEPPGLGLAIVYVDESSPSASARPETPAPAADDAGAPAIPAPSASSSAAPPHVPRW